MRRYRLSSTAQADIVEILARTEERFGEDARLRYEMLIVGQFATSRKIPNVLARLTVRNWARMREAGIYA